MDTETKRKYLDQLTNSFVEHRMTAVWHGDRGPKRRWCIGASKRMTTLSQRRMAESRPRVRRGVRRSTRAVSRAGPSGDDGPGEPEPYPCGGAA